MRSALSVCALVLGLAACAAGQAANPDTPATVEVTKGPSSAFPPIATVATAPSAIPAEPGARVARVVFEGNHELSNRDLRAAMRAEEQFAREAIVEELDHDVVALQGAYWDAGFLDVALRKSEERDAGLFVDARIAIVEGPRYQVGRVKAVEVDLHGKPRAALGKTPLVDLLSAKPGFTFQRSALVYSLTAIDRLYRDAGYAGVEHDVSMPKDVAKRTVDVDVVLRRGPLVHIARVVVIGNQRVALPTIEAVIMIKAGDPYNETKIEESVERISELGSFEDVQVTTASDAGGAQRTLTFEVKEGAPSAPPSGTALVEGAEKLYAEGRRAEARAMLAKVARLYPYSPVARRASLRIADVDFELRSFARAAEEYETWAQLHPSDPDAARALARAEEARR